MVGPAYWLEYLYSRYASQIVSKAISNAISGYHGPEFVEVHAISNARKNEFQDISIDSPTKYSKYIASEVKQGIKTQDSSL